MNTFRVDVVMADDDGERQMTIDSTKRVTFSGAMSRAELRLALLVVEELCTNGHWAIKKNRATEAES